jgi:hypothetical protein
MITRTIPATSVLAQIAALKHLSREEMLARWRELFGTEPPGFGPDLLRRRLAYRIQEVAYGGISAETRERLREIDANAQRPQKAKDPAIPIAGTVLIKEWGGHRHEVTILQDGFQYRGQKHQSLSAIARAITGTNWNGLRFFGLRGERSPQEAS